MENADNLPKCGNHSILIEAYREYIPILTKYGWRLKEEHEAINYKFIESVMQSSSIVTVYASVINTMSRALVMSIKWVNWFQRTRQVLNDLAVQSLKLINQAF